MFEKLKKILSGYTLESDMLGNEKFEWIIAGLGNPGQAYENTRHNIGWMVLDYLAKKFSMEFTHRLYFNYFTMNLHEHNIAFVKPNIFMNNSGEPIKRLVDLYEIPTEKLVVISDEVAFPVGKVHLKLGGSDGGHNGLASVIEKLETTNFARLRCGIGNDYQTGELSSYVLSNFPEEQVTLKKEMIKNAAESIEYLIDNGLTKAMEQINSGELFNRVM